VCEVRSELVAESKQLYVKTQMQAQKISELDSKLAAEAEEVRRAQQNLKNKVDQGLAAVQDARNKNKHEIERLLLGQQQLMQQQIQQEAQQTQQMLRELLRSQPARKWIGDIIFVLAKCTLQVKKVNMFYRA